MKYFLPTIVIFLNACFEISAQKNPDPKSGTIHVKRPKSELQKVNTLYEPEIFEPLEEMPQFPGGERALMLFLKNNLQYPETAKKNGISGTAYVSIRINATGNISGVKILSSPDSLMANEAIRVVNMMPQWNPGKLRGKPVNTVFVLPVRFTLL